MVDIIPNKSVGKTPERCLDPSTLDIEAMDFGRDWPSHLLSAVSTTSRSLDRRSREWILCSTRVVTCGFGCRSYNRPFMSWLSISIISIYLGAVMSWATCQTKLQFYNVLHIPILSPLSNYFRKDLTPHMPLKYSEGTWIYRDDVCVYTCYHIYIIYIHVGVDRISRIWKCQNISRKYRNICKKTSILYLVIFRIIIHWI